MQGMLKRRYEFMKDINKKGFFTLFLASAVLFSVVISASLSAEDISFSDIKGSDYYAQAAIALANEDILNGYPDGTFRAGNSITRAEMAAIAIRFLGLETYANLAKEASIYTDVPTAHWANGYINIATEFGIIEGDGNRKFRPDDNVKYEEAIKIVIGTTDLKEQAVRAGGWPDGYINTAKENNVLDNVPGSKGTISTRGAVALMVYQSMEHILSEIRYVYYPPNTVREETRTTDVIYFGNQRYYELNAHQVQSIYEDNSEYYKNLSVGDIVRINTKIRSETVNFGAAGGMTTITFEDIYSFEIVTEEYYRDNNFGAIDVEKNMLLTDGNDVSNVWLNGWKYIYSKDKGCYVSILATTGSKGIVFENGKKTGEYDYYLDFPLKEYKWLILVNDTVSIAEIETGLTTGDYSKFYCFAKILPPYRTFDYIESNIKNFTLNIKYQGNDKFSVQNPPSVLGYYYLNEIDVILSEYADCSKYEIGDIFKINADFIHEGFRNARHSKRGSVIEKLYMIEKL